MKLSEINIEPIWDSEKKNYSNERLDFETIEEIVFSNIYENGLSSEFAICFGTSRKIEMCKRVEKVVELYKQGRIKKGLFTGGKNGISSAKNNQTPEEIRKENENISYLIQDNFTEAERMKNYALELGMPKESILTDPISNNSNETLQNITKFIPMQENDNLILITSAYHLKRCLASAKKYVGKNLTFQQKQVILNKKIIKITHLDKNY